MGVWVGGIVSCVCEGLTARLTSIPIMHLLCAQCEALRPVLLDVTKEEQVQTVADKIDAENPQGIFALVNNAGACTCTDRDVYTPPSVSMYRLACGSTPLFGVVHLRIPAHPNHKHTYNIPPHPPKNTQACPARG